jgi:hypothetical protein
LRKRRRVGQSQAFFESAAVCRRITTVR